MSINDYYFNKLHYIKDSSNSIYHDLSILMEELLNAVRDNLAQNKSDDNNDEGNERMSAPFERLDRL